MERGLVKKRKQHHPTIVSYLNLASKGLCKNLRRHIWWKYLNPIDRSFVCIAHNKNIKIGPTIVEECARYGYIRLLYWAHKKGYEITEWTFAITARAGCLDFVKLSEKNFANGFVMYNAAIGGKMNILEYAKKQQNLNDNDICRGAAAGGHLEVLKWARENKYPWDFRICKEAAHNGHLEVLKWARENGCGWWKDEILENCTHHPHIIEWVKLN